MSEIVDGGAVGFGGSCNTWFPRILRHGGFAGSGWTHAGVGCNSLIISLIDSLFDFIPLTF